MYQLVKRCRLFNQKTPITATSAGTSYDTRSCLLNIMNPIPAAVNSTPFCLIQFARGDLTAVHPCGDTRQQFGLSKVDPSLKELRLRQGKLCSVRSPLPPTQEGHPPHVDAWKRSPVSVDSCFISRRRGPKECPAGNLVRLIAIIKGALGVAASDPLNTFRGHYRSFALTRMLSGNSCTTETMVV
jgi:hypothetical protein